MTPGRQDPTSSPVALVAGTAVGRRQAARLAEAWPHAHLLEGGSVAEALRTAWRTHTAVVAFVATGIVVRVLAPLLGDKHTDPAVVVVDETGRYAIALLSGHLGGANELARQAAATLGAQPVLTTATDLRGIPGLDTLGWPVEGNVAAVTRAVLDGEPVRLAADATWPLPAWPENVCPDAAAAHTVRITDRTVPLAADTVVLRPPSLVAGVGASRGVGVDELDRLLRDALAQAGLSPASLRCLATADIKADEPGIRELAHRYGLELVCHPVDRLARVNVPTPSQTVQSAVGTPSVAEAAALLPPDPAAPRPPAAGHPGPATTPDGVPGPLGELVVAKTTSPMGTVAVARHAPRGRLTIIGIGPGARDLLTPRATTELRRASVVVGLRQYVAQIQDLLRPGTRVLTSAMGAEQRRIHLALDQAHAGHAVALVSSGDPGVYAMASPALDEVDTSIDVIVVPGISAAQAASAILGAPLGHDHTVISLSDLHTPWPAIRRRVRAAAEADLVAVFYNPRSRGRGWQLAAALAELAAHRPPGTPVGLVRNASRPDEHTTLSTLADFDPAQVDMYGLVIVGNSTTRVVAGRMITPRGYRWRETSAGEETPSPTALEECP
jgi:cobalt-precorrin 5A hydrolase/precorrin-3B C17-methyltransferase